MKKISIEALLLLSNVYNRKQIADLCRELKACDGPEIEALLAEIDNYKSLTFEATSKSIEAKLEKKRAALEVERNKQEQLSSTTKEVSHLLLTRYGLKPPQAARQLATQLVQRGYSIGLEGEPKKAAFLAWLKDVCTKVPKDTVLNAALALRPA